MKKEYKVNNIFKEEGQTFEELINFFLLSFLDKEFNLFKDNGIINTDIISSL